MILAALVAAVIAGCDGDETRTPGPATSSPTATATASALPGTSTPTATATVSATAPATETAEPSATATPTATESPEPTTTPEGEDLAPVGLSAADLKAQLAVQLGDPGSDFRKAIAAQYSAELPGFADRPYYLIEARAEPDAGRLTLRETIVYTNPTDRTLDTLHLRVFANAPYFSESGDNVSLGSVRVDGRDTVKMLLEGTILSLGLPDPLDPGEAVRLDIELEQGIPPLSGPGLDLGSLGGGDGNYGLYGFGGEILTLGHWYPSIIAWGPEGSPPLEFTSQGDISFYEAGFYRVRLTAPASFDVAGSGMKVADEALGDGRVTEWVAPLARDVALLASPQFESRVLIGDSSVVRAVFPRDTPAEAQDALLETADAAIAAYDGYFGAYVYPEIDVVVGPLQNGAGGMEYSGLVVIDDDLTGGALAGDLDLGDLLDDPELQRAFEEFFGDLDLGSLLPGLNAGGTLLEHTVAHEVAHQWWFSAVGSDSIRHPWMDESLTNYAAILYFEDRYGPDEAATAAATYLAGAYGSARVFGEPDAPVDQPVNAFGQLQYGGIVYGKGALFYDALRNAAGDDAFFEGLKDYYERYRFGLAPDGAPVEAIKDAGADATTVDGVYERWIEETHGDEDIGVVGTGFDPGDLGDLQALLDELLNPQ